MKDISSMKSHERFAKVFSSGKVQVLQWDLFKRGNESECIGAHIEV